MANQNTRRKQKKEQKEAGVHTMSKQERKERATAKLIEYVQSLEGELDTVLRFSRSLFDVSVREKKGHAKIRVDLKFPEFKKHMKDWLAKKLKEKPQEANLIRAAYNRAWERFNGKEGLFRVVSKRIEEITQQERQGVTETTQELAIEHPGAYKRYTQLRGERACEVCFKEGRGKFKGKCEACREKEGKPEWAVMSFVVYVPKFLRLKREKRDAQQFEGKQ